jgi:hypothetical protein
VQRDSCVNVSRWLYDRLETLVPGLLWICSPEEPADAITPVWETHQERPLSSARWPSVGWQSDSAWAS